MKKKSIQMIVSCILSVLIGVASVYFYAKHLDTIHKNNFEELSSTIAYSKDIQTTIWNFALENDAYVKVTDQLQHTTYQTAPLKGHEGKVLHAILDGTNSYLIDVTYSNVPLIATGNVVCVVVGLVWLAYAILLIFSKPTKVKGDYKELIDKTTTMLEVNQPVNLETDTEDEQYRQLVNNINGLYEKLIQYKQQIRSFQDENTLLTMQLSDAYQNYSKPIVKQVNDLQNQVAKMINKEGAYANTTYGLLEMKMALESLSRKLGNKPEMPLQKDEHYTRVRVENYFKELADGYALQALEKRISFSYAFEEGFETYLNKPLFENAFAHLMHFVLKQADPQTNIVIVQSEFAISVAYRGACLTDASIQQVKEIDDDVHTLFSSMEKQGIYLSYVPTGKMDGMQFVFQF